MEVEIVKKSIAELVFPAELSYHAEHAWAREESGEVCVGISDFAQDQLGDVIYVELPAVGDTFKQGDSFGIVESAKSVSTLYMPVSGEIIAVNDAVDSSTELINQSPYADGWLVRVKPDGKDALMTAAEYKAMLEAK